MLRIDGVNLDTYKYNSNEGTIGTQAPSTNLEGEEECLSSLLEMGRGGEGGPGKPGDHWSWSWKYKSEFKKRLEG